MCLLFSRWLRVENTTKKTWMPFGGVMDGDRVTPRMVRLCSRELH